MNTTRIKQTKKNGGGWKIYGYVNGKMVDCSWTDGNVADARMAELEMRNRWHRAHAPTAAQIQAAYEEAMGRS